MMPRPRILCQTLALLTLLTISGVSFGQSLYDVVISLSDRQRIISQRDQVKIYLENQNNSPTDTDENIPAEKPINWFGVGTVPTLAAVEGLSFGGKNALLNQAAGEFNRLKTNFLNSSEAELNAGMVIGTLQSYAPCDFDPLSRATPENYHELLGLLTQRVGALRLIQWPAAFSYRKVFDYTHVWEQLEYDSSHHPYVKLMPEGTSPTSFTWRPNSIGNGNLIVQNLDPETEVTTYFDSFVQAYASYSQSDGVLGGVTLPLRKQWISYYVFYPEQAQVSSTAPGGDGLQIDGTVYILRRSYWHGISTDDIPTRYNKNQAGFAVEGGKNSGSIPLFADPPTATIHGSWVKTAQDGSYISQSFVENGYQLKKASYLPRNDPGFSDGYDHSYEQNWKIGCVFYPVFKPTFTRGVDAVGMRSKLDSAAAIMADNTADGELLLHPRPALLFGIRLGPGLRGAGNGFISGGYQNAGSDGSKESYGFFGYYPDYATYWDEPSPMLRFDSTYSLHFAGSCADYHVVYENDRAVRTQNLPADGIGWPYTDPNDESAAYDTRTLYRAWDSPRLKQVAGRDLVADIEYNSSHYGGYTVKVYRRPSGSPAPIPGVALSTSGMSLIRTWAFTHPGAGTPAHPTDPEKLEATGNNGEFYEIQANHMLPNLGLRAPDENYWNGSNWWTRQSGLWSWTLKLSHNGTGMLSEDIAITTVLNAKLQFESDLSISSNLDGQNVSLHSSKTLNPFNPKVPTDWKITSAGKTITGSATLGAWNNAGSGYGKWPTSVTINYGDIQPTATYAWDTNGLLSSLTQGPWTTTGTVSGGAYQQTHKLNDSTYSTNWTEFTDGGNKVKTYTAPDGNAGDKSASTVAWSEIEYGTTTAGLPGLPLVVRNSDGTGSTFGWNAGSDGSYVLTLEDGLLSGSSVSRGTKLVHSANTRGFPTKSESFVINGGTVRTSGTTYTLSTAWGMPQKATDSNTGLSSSWTCDGVLSRLGSLTSGLGTTSTSSGYDALGRPVTVSHNGITATNTYTALSTTSTITGSATGFITHTRDALGRLTSSNTTWNGVTDNLAINRGGSSDIITRTQSLLGSHQATLRKEDGTLATAAGPTLPFGGTDNTALAVDGGLLKTTAELGDQSSAYQTTWPDAWGRIRKISTPSTSGGGADETLTTYSDPSSSLKRAITTEASGRKLITESDPYNASGAIRRSGIDVNQNGSLGTSDRYVESITTVSGSSLVTVLKLTEDTDLREILRTEWTPAGNVTVTTLNGGEETITRTPNYAAKTVTTTSTKGWSKTEDFNNLGLTTTSSSLSGPGVPAANLTSTWRADGSLSGVSLTIGGETHSATFNNNGTLSSLNAPGRGNILDGHSISGGVETLTVAGVTTTRKLDGTQETTSGSDVTNKTEVLTLSGSGFKQTTTPTIGAATATILNAAGAATAKNYAAGAGESPQYLPGGLLEKITLARGGDLTFGYSNDGAKDLTSATWPAVASGPFTIPAIVQGYGYDRAGRINEIGDNSGVRTIAYQNGRLATTTWTTGTLARYKQIKGYDTNGRETGTELWRGNRLLHPIAKAPNGVTGEVSAISSGAFTATYGRDAARNIISITRGPVTQNWSREASGRITAATNNVPGAPNFAYTSFDAKGRRLNCATTGGEWTYTYGTAGQLASAIHPTCGNFIYQFDAIGRRTDKGSANTASLLNQTLAWTNSQNKTLKITAAPAARVWFNGTEIPGFTGSYSYAIPSPGASGGWVPWNTLAVLPCQGDAGANADAKAEQSGAVWVPPINESLTYDPAGNRQSSALWDYGWNAKNELTRARTKNYIASGGSPSAPQGYDITNAYDAEGRRFSKKVNRYQNGSIVDQKTITFIHDGNDLTYERHQLKSGLTILERRYVWGPDISGTHGGAGGAGGLLLIQETKGNVTTDLYPLYDGSGNVVALADSSGKLVGEFFYTPFGELIYARGPKASSCPFRYATKYLDEETGIYYFGRRFLDPITGQWLSREPLGESESLNLYSYCHNDPINYVDVSGLWEINTQEAANNQRVEWLLMQLSAGSGLPIAPPDEWKLYFPEKGDFGLYKPYGQEDYKNAQTFVQNLGRPTMRASASEEAAAARQPSFGPAPAWIPSTTAALTLGAANTPLNASINSDWLLPTGAGAAGAKFLFGGMKSMLPILAAGARTEGRLLTAEMRAGLSGGTGGAAPELFWHGSTAGVARRNAGGIFVDGAGNGGLFWTTSKEINELGPLAWKVGGNTNVRFVPPGLVNKGGLEATYRLTSTESAMFRRAWGPTFNWNPYQWWKGAAGQYYFRPNPASWGQRFGEVGKAAGIAGVWMGAPYLYYELTE